MYDDYVKNPGFGILNPLVRFFFKLFVKPLRKADYKAAKRPDYFITISDHAKNQIKKYYERDAIVIHPPVEIEDFKLKKETEPLDLNLPKPFINISRQVNWKRLDLCVKACLKTNQPLVLIGEGPEHEHLVKLTNGSPLIKFMPVMDKESIRKHLQNAKAYLFPSLEPFGIAPVEALAAGCPVIAFKEGGALDYVEDEKNGLLFEKQNVQALVEAIEKFEKMQFDSQKVSASANKFSVERFNKELKEFVDEKTC